MFLKAGTMGGFLLQTVVLNMALKLRGYYFK
jgi:hypothetical protein